MGAGQTDLAAGTDPDAGELYATPLLLPFLVGTAAILAGAVLVWGEGSRLGALVVLLDAGVALLIVGAALYFLIGFWLVPGSVALGGLLFLVGFEVESHLRWLAVGAGAVFGVVGAVGELKALVELRRRLPLRDPSA